MKEKCANKIIGGTDGTLGFAVLLGGIWPRKTEEDAMGGAKKVKFGVVKLSAIVTLDRKDTEIKLSLSIGVEGEEGSMDIRFLA